ncbi:hypothetical protein ACQRCQ_11950 [Lachnospiraceae bacterium SGI.085]
MEYMGNAIYDYVYNEDLDYYYSAEHNWMLVYGNSASIPKIMVFASKVADINSDGTADEMKEANKALSIARYLKLPFIFVRFMVNNDLVGIWEESVGKWQTVTYDQLRDIYERYGVVQPGTARKRVNQYTSSPYHDWQRNNLGRITVSDFDLIKYNNGQVQEIIELKRSKIPLNTWTPYPNDYPNFALLINTIVGSGKDISFTLYYNLMRAGQMGMRVEDTSQIKVFDFIIPKNMISSNQVQYRLRGYYKLDQLLN